MENEISWRLRRTEELLRMLSIAVRDGFKADPGTSDLDDEQPIVVRMKLGDWRRAHWITLQK